MNNLDIQWGLNHLCTEGYRIHNSIPESIQNTAWSRVLRFETDKGFIYLKTTPQKLSIEPNVITILRNQYNADVPKVIAINNDLNCFLMRDAGISLHSYFHKNFETDIFIKILHHYSKLQISTANQLDIFFKAGVPDWKMEKFPSLYSLLISQEDLLMGDGLSEEEITKLKRLEPKLTLICEKLSLYKIKDTFAHADFHDKNILINPETKQTTLIDLGEVVVTHPFFSFNNCLHMAKEHFLLTDIQHRELQIACFKPWLELESHDRLLEIISLIQQCWSIHAALGEFRLLNSVDPSDYEKLRRQGRLSGKLRVWMQTKFV